MIEVDQVLCDPVVGPSTAALAAGRALLLAQHVKARRLQLMLWDRLLNQKLTTYKNDQHTCLLDSLQFAAGQIPNMDLTPASRVDLVVISDMIEDCQSSPMGPGVHLDKHSIQREIQQVRQFPTGRIRLPQTKVYILIPPGSGAGPNDARVEDVETFWRVFLERCGVRPENLVISVGRVPEALLQD
jgi:hypothetical protein